MEDSTNIEKDSPPEALEDYIKTKDDTYTNKSKREIIELFNIKNIV
jgi:hypothetical protein